MKKPTKESDFSTDLLVMAKIYEYNFVRCKPIWHSRLWRCMKGKMTQGAMSRAVERNYDLGIIDSDWGKVDEKWARIFSISSEAKDFAKNIYKHIKEVRRRERKCHIAKE